MSSTFTYMARNATGQVIEGKVSAIDKTAATHTLTEQGLKPILVKDDGKNKALGGLKSHKIRGKVKNADLVIFTRQLSTMVSAGVPIVRSLATLQAQVPNKAFKEALGQVTKKVESGVSLGDALAEHPRIFSEIYVNMVRAGEEGGILDEVLQRLALQAEKDAAIKAKVKGAMTYPMVIGGITLFAFYGLIAFLVPKLGKIIVDLGAPLPIQTKIMLFLGNFMRKPLFLLGMIIVLVAGFILLKKYLRTDKGKLVFDRLLLRLPVFKVLLTKVAIARFARIFSSLMAAGVTVLVAIETTSAAIGNKVIQNELAEAAKKVRNGTQFSVAISEGQHFPPIVSQMLAVGEETGQTDKVLVKVAEFYEEEVDIFIRSITSIIEPMMLIMLGGLVVLIVVSVLGPLYGLTNHLG